MAELPVTPVKVQPASAKNAGQSSARQTEAADSDNKSSSFASELNKRMDSGKAEREAPARDSGKAAAAGREEAADPAEGKKLPARAGNEAAEAEAAQEGAVRAEADLASDLLADTDNAGTETQGEGETEVSPLALAQMLLDAAPPRPGSGAEAGEGRSLKPDSTRAQGDAARLLMSSVGSDGSRASVVGQSVQEALQDTELTPDLFRQLMARGGEQRSETATAQLAQLAARHPDAQGLQRLVSAEAMVTQTPVAAQTPTPAAQPAAAGAQGALPTTQIPLPIQHPQWGDALSEKVVWAANQKLQGAEIKLNPPQLGPIEVRVSLNSDSGQSQAQVHFTAQHALTRDALESAMPRLREMFTANGMDLVDVNVSDRSFSEQDRDTAQSQQKQFMAGLDAGVQGEEGGTEVSTKITQLPSGVLDLFA